jgi:hypothetical protein
MAAFERVRGWADLSRVEAAELLGTDPFTIARYDAGARVPDDHAKALGTYAGVAPEFVQRGDEIMRAEIQAMLDEAGW